MDLKPKCKCAASYKYQPTWKDMLWDMGTSGLWNQRRGKEEIVSLKFFIALSYLLPFCFSNFA